LAISSSQLPQADKLDDVIAVADAVNLGNRTFQDIADHIGKVGRQGRYYRLAAQILGLVRNQRNQAVLTDLGQSFINATGHDRENILKQAVLSAQIFQRMLPFLENNPNGVTRTEIIAFLHQIMEPVGVSMIPRRASTIISWLERVGLVQLVGDRYRLRIEGFEAIPVPEFDDNEPLVPQATELREYDTVNVLFEEAETTVQVMRNQAAVERAIEAHTNLVNLVAERLRRSGYLPRCNQMIDLAVSANDTPYIFEMKSITPDNARRQLRQGLSQLYEYRYLQNRGDATLVLVIEAPLPVETRWMQQYMEHDRGIRLLWDGDDELYGSDETCEKMPFLWPN